MTELAPNPARRSLRKLWFQAHKWIALALMILLIPLGLSGVVLAWDDAIDHALHPRRYAVHGDAILPPAAYAAAAHAAMAPGERIAQLRYADGEGPVTIATVTAPGPGIRPARGMIWLDPASARLLDRDAGDGGLIRFAHDFHGSLFVPGIGRALVGLLGVALFLLAASGVWLWWPPMGRWTRGLRWRRGDRRLDTSLHHMAGFWIALPLAAQAFTGVWIASPQMLALIGAGAPSGGPRGRPVPIADPARTPDAVLAAARALVGGAPDTISWPTGRDAWTVTFADGRHIAVDDGDGRARIAKARDTGGLASAMRHWHDGTTLGFYWRLVMIPIGLAPTLLGVTGLLMWLRGRRRRNRAGRGSA